MLFRSLKLKDVQEMSRPDPSTAAAGSPSLLPPLARRHQLQALHRAVDGVQPNARRMSYFGMLLGIYRTV